MIPFHAHFFQKFSLVVLFQKRHRCFFFFFLFSPIPRGEDLCFIKLIDMYSLSSVIIVFCLVVLLALILFFYTKIQLDI